MADVLKLVPDVFREFFLQEKAQDAVSSRSAEQETRIRDYVTAADARLAAAESLTSGDQVPAALLLYRDGIVFTGRALLESRGKDSSVSATDGVFRALASLVEDGHFRGAPDGFEAVRALLCDPRPLAFDELPAREALAKRAEVEATALWLRGLVDARSVRQIKWTRALRVGALCVVLLGFLGLGVAKLVGPRNVALGKPVQLSSRRPLFPPGTSEAGAPPSGLVDGKIGDSYDICTNSEVRPWAVVDLQQIQRISKIIAYYRGDCCWGQYDLPAVIEISEDGTNYREVGRRTTAYSASDPWVVKIDRQPARFVRIRVDSNENRELVMTELEVYVPRF